MMSTTIGIALTAHPSANDLLLEITTLAETYGYGVACGLESVERDVLPGLEIAVKLRGLEEVLLLRTPPGRNANLAYDINREIIEASMSRTPAVFHQFLRDVWNISEKKVSNMAVFFCEDWYVDEGARYYFGSIDDLVFLLSMTGGWGGVRLTPTGTFQVFDEIPFMFEFEELAITAGSAPAT